MKKQMNENTNENIKIENPRPRKTMHNAMCAQLTPEQLKRLKRVPLECRNECLYQWVIDKFDYDLYHNKQNRIFISKTDSPELVTAQIINFRNAIENDQFIVTFI